jgi:hypothetical protein
MAPSADRHASPLIRRLAPGKGFPERKAALTAARSNTPAQCPRWVKRVGLVMSVVCPVYPQHQTFPDPVGTSRLGHYRKSPVTVLKLMNSANLVSCSTGRSPGLPSCRKVECGDNGGPHTKCRVFCAPTERACVRRLQRFSSSPHREDQCLPPSPSGSPGAGGCPLSRVKRLFHWMSFWSQTDSGCVKTASMIRFSSDLAGGFDGAFCGWR